jgi:hypothetical protein
MRVRRSLALEPGHCVARNSSRSLSPTATGTAPLEPARESATTGAGAA